LADATSSGSQGGYKDKPGSHAISFILVPLFSFTELPKDKTG